MPMTLREGRKGEGGRGWEGRREGEGRREEMTRERGVSDRSTHLWKGFPGVFFLRMSTSFSIPTNLQREEC